MQEHTHSGGNAEANTVPSSITGLKRRAKTLERSSGGLLRYMPVLKVATLQAGFTKCDHVRRSAPEASK